MPDPRLPTGDPLSGRFVRVPVEFNDRELYPWMKHAAWRESYIRLQRNRSVQDHDREFGGRHYHLKQNELLVSIPWLCRSSHKFSEKSAREFLSACKRHGLIGYPRGKRMGAHAQIIRLTQPWRKPREIDPTVKSKGKGEVEPKKGRGESRRKPRHRGALRKAEQEKRRGEKRKRARSESEVPGSDSQADRGDTDRAGSEGNGSPTGARGFGWQQPEKGEVAGGGDIGGEGEQSPPERDESLSPPERDDDEHWLPPPPEAEPEEQPAPPPPRLPLEATDALLDFAKAYCAPSDRGVLPLKGREVKDLRGLIVELLEQNSGDHQKVRDWFVNARRLADSRGSDRVNATYLRMNSGAIGDHNEITLDDTKALAEIRRQQEEDDAKRREEEENAVRLQERVRLWDTLDDKQKESMKRRASTELGAPDFGPTDERLKRFWAPAILMKAYELMEESHE